MKSNNSLNELKRDRTEKELLESVVEDVWEVRNSSESLVNQMDNIRAEVNEEVSTLYSLRKGVYLIVVFLVIISVLLGLLLIKV